MVARMLAIMRGNVEALYPTRPAPRRGKAPAPAAALNHPRAKRAAGLAEDLWRTFDHARRRPRYVPLAARMQAASWLTNRAFGKAPFVVELKDDDRKPALDLSRYTEANKRELRRFMELGRPGPATVGRKPARVLPPQPPPSGPRLRAV